MFKCKDKDTPGVRDEIRFLVKNKKFIGTKRNLTT